MGKFLGIDVGSTTVKTVVVAEENGEILYSDYSRHFSKVKECVLSALEKIGTEFPSRFSV